MQVKKLICLAILEYNNLSLKTFYEKVKNIPAIEGRGKTNEIIIDDKKILFIDESYNASPNTMKICIDYFYELELQDDQKKYIILGEMNELGKFSEFFFFRIFFTKQNKRKQKLTYSIDKIS